MLSWLVTTSLRMRALVIAAAALVVVLGVQRARDAAYDVFPEFAPPRVEVQTEAPGLSTEEVETLISRPLENALNGVPGLAELHSKSVLGLSQVTMHFVRGTDLLRARQLVAERLATATRQLPAAVSRPPVILQPLSSTSRAMKIGVWSERLDQVQLTDLARWVVRPRLMAVPGVANVAIWGQRDRQFQVLVDGDRLRNHGVTLDVVSRAAADAVAVGAGGFVDSPNQRVAVSHRSAVQVVDDLAKAPIPGTRLALGDVADVVEGHQVPIGDAIVNDQPGLLLIVEKHVDGNTLAVTRGVEAAMEELRPALAGVEFDTTVFRPATFVERSLHNLGDAMLLGCILVVMVLLAFLYEWRTAVISLLAIPLSTAAAMLVLDHFGGTIDTMVLAGLVIALGEVVDDAIIDVENIDRRLRLERASDKPRHPLAVVLGASLEVRSAVVYASLIVVLVFLPVFFLDGLAGAFFRPLAFAYVVAILASLLVAVTVTPALSLLLLSRGRREAHDPPLQRALKRVYGAVLPAVTRRPRLALATLVATLLGTGFAATQLGENLLPDFRETDFLMHFVEPPGTSLEAMDRVTIRASKDLRGIPGVRNFGSHIGRAEVADEVVGPNFTELWISIDENADHDATVGRIRDVIAGYPGLKRDVLTYLKERTKEVLTGTSASIVVRTFGPDLDVLRSKAKQILAAIADLPGVVDAQVESQHAVPQLSVALRPESLQRFGLAAGQAWRAATTMVRGDKVGEVLLGQQVVDVVVRGDDRDGSGLERLRAAPVALPAGGQVALGEIADVQFEPAPNQIVREEASRRIDVTCNVRGRDIGSVARDVEAALSGVPFERGYHARVLGEYDALQRSRERLLWFALLGLLGVFVLLQVDFQSVRASTIVFATLPFALVGGVAGAWLGGGNVSLGSLVGFVTVLGIAARNGIMMVSHFRHLELDEGVPFGPELIRRGAMERLAPICMTAGCAALALVPLVVRGNVPGQEIEYPMALVILGGLATSTLMNLFLLPSLYGAFGRPAVRAEA
ncbi:MAG: efflux RND transporter permease subunit [Planctomycetes bacterium]|nr:efflux RND transporter permease subunit [Planctomycetota bacterium]